jgi:predicted RNA-binding protein with RPS1 domain
MVRSNDDREIVLSLCFSICLLFSFPGTVVEIKDFGAVVELLRNKEGLLHVSELVPDYKEAISGNPKGAEGFVRQHLRVGQTVEVLCTGVDPVNGSVKLSRNALFERKNER